MSVRSRSGDTAMILVVDDNESDRSLLCKCVKAAGYECVAVESGLAAIAAMGKGIFSAVLLDLGLPDISGLEVLTRIREDKNLNKIPVAVITGMGDKDSVIRCMELGANDYIEKPCDFLGIKERVRSLIEAGGQPEVVAHRSLITSLSHSGARIQFAIAATLVSIIPALALLFVLFGDKYGYAISHVSRVAILGCSCVLVILGYVLLLKYPINVIRLRQYLALLAKGTIPERIDLIKEEDDLEAIEDYMINIIEHTEQRIKTIERQSSDLLEAEKQRAMIESLGAACHHLGQPATVITTYLQIIEKKAEDPELLAMIQECRKAASEMRDIFDKLQSVSEYRTEPYRPLGADELTRSDDNIIDINKE